MRFREHRGGLNESMSTVVELDPTIDALKAHLNGILENWKVTRPLKLNITHYAYDSRINWDTYMVKAEGSGFVVGFTDQMPE